MRILFLFLISFSAFNQDSLLKIPTKIPTKAEKIVPKKAFWRSMILPGLGQAYIKQYWTIPIWYGGLGLAAYSYNFNQNRLDLYSNSLTELINNTNNSTITVNGIALNKEQLISVQKFYRRNRDFTLILTGLGWILNAVQANVSAHLKDFSTENDLTWKIKPAINSIDFQSYIGISFIKKMR